jgi:hypothetical protein
LLKNATFFHDFWMYDNLLLRRISDWHIMSLMLGKFKEIESQFQKLKQDYQSRKIDGQEFKQRLKELRLTDKSGRCWTIGAKTGGWYYFDGTSWVEATPPSSESGKTACHFCGFENQLNNNVCDYCGGDLDDKADQDPGVLESAVLDKDGMGRGALDKAIADIDAVERSTSENDAAGRGDPLYGAVDHGASDSSAGFHRTASRDDLKRGAVDSGHLVQDAVEGTAADTGYSPDIRMVAENGAPATGPASGTAAVDTGRLDTADEFETPRKGKEFTWEGFDSFGRGPDEEIESYLEAGAPNVAIRSFSPLSFLLFFGTLGAFFGLIFGVFLGISTYFADIVASLPLFLQNQHGTLFGGVIYGLLGGVIGFAALGGLGALYALFVNLILSFFGGIKMRIDRIS